MIVHEAANLFPLDEDHIDELARDIKTNGQLLPVELLNGEVLDGRRRCLACERLGITPKTKNVSVDDPIAYVISLNLMRRQLTASQRAMVGVKAKAMYSAQAKERQRESGKIHGRGQEKVVLTLAQPIHGKARDLAGEAVQVSGSMIDYAETVIEEGVPELAKAVEEGRMSVTAAAKATELDEDTQREIASEAEFSGGRYRQRRKSRPDTPTPPESTNGKIKGVGVIKGNEAVNCLMSIPKDDALRKRGFQIVTDYIRRNR